MFANNLQFISSGLRILEIGPPWRHDKKRCLAQNTSYNAAGIRSLSAACEWMKGKTLVIAGLSPSPVVNVMLVPEQAIASIYNKL